MHMTNPVKEKNDDDRYGKPNVSILLAEQVLGLFERSGTTPKEQNTALDIVRTLVLDRLYATNALVPHSGE